MASEEDDYSQGSGCGSDVEEESVDENDYSAATDRRKHYKILNEDDIRNLQEYFISTVSGVLSIPSGLACTLLCRNKWSLTSVLKDFSDSIKQICRICCDDSLQKEVVSADCGHPFCADCLKSYIATAVSGGAACLTLQCPDPGCKAAVTADMVEKLASEADFGRYQQYLRGSYVESCPEIKWCPAAGCDRAVEFDFDKAVGSQSYDVVCDCSHKFCWRCGEEWHRPVDCAKAVEWLKMKRSEGESVMWIVENTKPCPSCGRPIEKGETATVCNFMRCRPPCNFTFCWVCSSEWIGGDKPCFGCDKHKKDVKGKTEDESRSPRMKAMGYRGRYIHWYERWDSKDKLWKRAMDDMERVRRGYAEKGPMQFVVEAWEQIVECRRVLKWSYAHGYYLETEGAMKGLYEILKKKAERAVERLQHCVEKEVIEYDDNWEDFVRFRGKLLFLTGVVRGYFENLVVAFENDLAEVDHENLVIDLDNYVLAGLEENSSSTQVEDFDLLALKLKALWNKAS